MSQRSFNIFSDLIIENNAMKAVSDFLSEKECDESNETFKKLKGINEEFISMKNLKSYSKIVSSLASKKAIYYLNLTYDEVADILQNPNADDVSFPKPYNDILVSDSIAERIKQESKHSTGEEASKTILSIVSVSQDNNGISYFYIEDLISVVMENIEAALEENKDFENAEYFEFIKKRGIKVGLKDERIKQYKNYLKNTLQQFQQLRVLLGPIEIYSPEIMVL